MLISADSFIDFFIPTDNGLWFIDGKNLGIFCADLPRNEIGFIEAIPNSIVGKIRMFNAGIKYGNTLVFCPFNSDLVLLYDITQNSIEKIAINGLKGKAQFTNVLLNGDELIMVDTYKEHVVIIVNLIKKTYELFSFGMLCDVDAMLSRDVVRIGKRLYVACLKEPIIIEFDLFEKKFRKINIKKGRGVGTITSIGNELWITDKNMLIKVDQNGECDEEYECELVACNEEDSEGWGQTFFRSFVVDEDIFFVPSKLSDIYCYSLNFGAWNKYEVINQANIDEENKRYSSLAYLGIQKNGNSLFLYSVVDNSIYEFDLVKKSVKARAPFEISDKSWIKCMVQNKSIMNENEKCDMRAFTRFIGEG